MMPCPLDPEILVFVLEPEGGLEQRFAASHAFSVYGRGVAGPFIVVDARLRRQPWFTEDHMLALIAHEPCACCSRPATWVPTPCCATSTSDGSPTTGTSATWQHEARPPSA
jgi:hypothetical protein